MTQFGMDGMTDKMLRILTLAGCLLVVGVFCWQAVARRVRTENLWFRTQVADELPSTDPQSTFPQTAPRQPHAGR